MLYLYVYLYIHINTYKNNIVYRMIHIYGTTNTMIDLKDQAVPPGFEQFGPSTYGRGRETLTVGHEHRW